MEEYDVIDDIKLKFKLPTEEDIEGAHLGIHRLQMTYLIPAKDFKKGKFNANISSFREMTGKQKQN
jgi:hypothetical protein